MAVPLFCLLASMVCSVTSYAQARPHRDKEGHVRLRAIPVPPDVFSIRGEVVAFEALGEEAAPVTVDLGGLMRRQGPFSEVIVIECNAFGDVSSHPVPLNGRRLKFRASARSKYLIYANLGIRFRNTYNLLCWMTKLEPPIQGSRIPEICKRILCAPDAMTVGRILSEFPELPQGPGVPLPPDEIVGGFGVCDRCLGTGGGPMGDFIPGDCEENSPFNPGGSRPASPCMFAGWAPYARSCSIPSREENRTWSDWTEFYQFYAGDDAAALSINLASEIPAAGFGALIDVVATYDDVTIFPCELHVRNLTGSVPVHVVGSPGPALEDSYVAFKSTTEFENGTSGRRRHHLFIKWSLPWGSSSCPAGVPLVVQGNVRDSRFPELTMFRVCESTKVSCVTGLQMSDAMAINGSNLVVGFDDTAGKQRAARWSNGSLDYLDAPSGATASRALDVNDSGVIVGDVTVDVNRACRWSGSSYSFSSLGISGGLSSIAIGINGAGQVVGRNDRDLGPWRLTATGPVGLPSLPGCDESLGIAYKINSDGVVAGMTREPGSPPHKNFAVVWSPGSQVKDLGLPAGMDEAVASDVNGARTVVGRSYVGDNLLGGKSHASIWTLEADGVNYAAELLPTTASLSGESAAAAINNQGDAVGYIQDSNGASHAVIWSDGRVIDLNEQIDASCGWTLLTATDINDSGAVVGRGMNPAGEPEAYLYQWGR